MGNKCLVCAVESETEDDFTDENDDDYEEF